MTLRINLAGMARQASVGLRKLPDADNDFGVGLTAEFMDQLIADIAEVKTDPEKAITFLDRYCIVQRTPSAEVAAEFLAERQRQVSAEGWSEKHDDEHGSGELADAAASYATAAANARLGAEYMKGNPPGAWPWSLQWWKPGTARRMLIKAAALIIAEVERLDRAAEKAGRPTHG
jgi:hypothetical protein